MTSILDDLDSAKLLINGKWVDGGAGRFNDTSPHDGKAFATVPDADEANVHAAVTAAREAFDVGPWPRMANEERRACLMQLAEALGRHEGEFTELAAVEWGVANDHMSQLAAAAYIAAGNAELALVEPFDRLVGPDGSTVGIQSYLPLGVVAAITPWNYPHTLNVTKITGAIATGNTVVLKPSPLSPLAALQLARLVRDETDIPPGVVNVVSTSSVAASAALTEDPRVDLISFTGSTAVGKQIAATAASRLARILLELGGKSAAIHMDDLTDSDYDELIERTVFEGCIRHAGQACILTSRLLVPANRHDEIVARLAASAAKVKVGDPRDESTQMGPVITAAQADAVVEKIQGAVDDGAQLAFGGVLADVGASGAYVKPTILADVRRDMPIAQEEVFGPVLAVIPYRSDEEAVEIANDTRYGLVGSVWGSDVARATKIASQLRTGQVSVNGAMSLGPFGGFKESGIGREQGLIGLRTYTEIRTVSYQDV